MKPHQAKKRFGQNFLADEWIIQQLIHLIDPKPEDHLLEIGPGLGALTFPLLEYVDHLEAVELDRDLIPYLEAKAQDRLTLHQQDALSLNLASLAPPGTRFRIIGNLPYNISTPLIFHLLDQKEQISDMHFMVQKEVAERLAATPGSKQFGRLSIMAQYHCEIESLLEVPPQAFKPAPKVDSSFIRLVPIEPKWVAHDFATLERIVKEAFCHRRKTLSNTLKNIVSKEQLLSLGIDPTLRPEALSIENFVRISNLLNTQQQKGVSC